MVQLYHYIYSFNCFFLFNLYIMPLLFANLLEFFKLRIIIIILKSVKHCVNYYILVCDVVPMEKKQGSIPMKERVKRYVPISNAADRFGVSRPTFYLFMQNYDEERTRDIPENIREFLDLVSGDPQPEDVKVFLMVKGNPSDEGKPVKIKDIRDDLSEYDALMREMKSLSEMVDSTEERYHDIRMTMDRTENELSTVQKLIEQNPEDNAEHRVRAEALTEKMKVLRNEMDKVQSQRVASQRSLSEIKYRLKEFEASRNFAVAGRRDSWTEDGDLMTLSIGSGGRSMVFFQLMADDAESPEYTVSLIMETPVGEMVIGEYVPEERKSFVLIDDVLPTLRIQYEVTCRYHEKTVRSGRYQLQFK